MATPGLRNGHAKNADADSAASGGGEMVMRDGVLRHGPSPIRCHPEAD